MTDARPLNQFYHIAERFTRSVNVAEDYSRPENLRDYIVTPLSKAVLSRIGCGLNGRGGAWSITGPYGAGKSAATLFVAEVLGYPVNTRARDLLKSVDRDRLDDLYEDVPGLQTGGYLVVPMMGSHEPISWTVLAGLVSGLSSLAILNRDVADHLNRVRELYARVTIGEAVPRADLMDAIQRSTLVVRASNPSALGLLIIYDELGKTLEYAALHPERSDVGILQAMAEAAARSEEAPVGLITILHQAFEHYAAHLSPVQQREWAKVQGRFEDIVFLASQGELLHLIDKAICSVRPPEGLSQLISAEVDEAEHLGILPGDVERRDALRTLAGCAPLHPTVTLVLARLFRSRLSQNERSLFAFLSSGEPYGLQEYLKQETGNEGNYRPFYRLHNLYDYIMATTGSAVYAQSRGKRWAEIEDALERLPKASGAIEAEAVKTIGLLGLLGDQRHLRASQQVLVYALADGRTVDDESVHRALRRLEEWGIVLYRRFKKAYSLWQGSDVDLDERFEQGMAHVDRSLSLASLLESKGELKPFVAKRHLHETGTFRYFVPWVVEVNDLPEVERRAFDPADGVVVFVLSEHGASHAELVAEVLRFSAQMEPPRQQIILFAVPRETRGIREAFHETLAWQWVAENTPELEGDSIARRELSARHLAAQQRLDGTAARCFDLAYGYQTSTWIWMGQELSLASARDLSGIFSQTCDLAYSQASIVLNELINRRSVSSAASAARRNLIEAMLEQGDQPKLGMEGYPPEMSMYLSVLEASGLHHQEGDSWVFGPAEGKDPCRVRPLWQAIDDFLTTTEIGPRPVTELYETLRHPPFGIKDGLLPVYVVAAMLHWEAEVALYEQGSFVPRVRPAECERLMRVPERFGLQRYRLDETRARMLYEYSALFGSEIDPGQVALLTAVRPILAFANQLPRYGQLTERLSQESMAVRGALFSAREPQRMLLDTLPHALGFEVENAELDEVQCYFSHLKRVLLELQRAYDALLTEIERQLLDALLLPSDMQAARREIAQRARILQEWVADLRLKAFVLRLGDAQLPRREWLESVAAGLTNKPPKQWNDGDALGYQVALAEQAAQFRRTEELALAQASQQDSTGTGRVLRLGVTDGRGREQREITRISPDQEQELSRLVSTLQEMLQTHGLDKTKQAMVVAELARRTLDSTPPLQEGGD